jgi:hypothetical protein
MRTSVERASIPKYLFTNQTETPIIRSTLHTAKIAVFCRTIAIDTGCLARVPDGVVENSHIISDSCQPITCAMAILRQLCEWIVGISLNGASENNSGE